MEIKNLEIDQSSKSHWHTYKDLLVNSSFFKKGVLVAKSEFMQDENKLQTKTFVLQDREFIFKTKKTISNVCSKTERAVKKAANLLRQIGVSVNSDLFIVNMKRREEILLPLVINYAKKNTGMYVYPWIDSTEQFCFDGFENFITCGCLFGANLKAIDKFGNEFPLIRHQNLREEQKIIRIEFNEKAANPYEEVLFLELQRMMIFINKFAKDGIAKNLIYHLPDYDYMLFGIKLFIHNKICYEDLDKFIQLIVQKAQSYRERINEICKAHNIVVDIQSPFDNLFGLIKQDKNITRTIFEILNLTPEEQANNCELLTTQRCLEKLLTNKYNLAQKISWWEFIDINGKEIKDFESLFKIANSVILGVASYGKDQYKTCSFLPLTEKQIQLHYSSVIKRSGSTKFSAVFNMTVLDSVISFSQVNNGVLFYQNACKDTLLDLIVNQKLLDYCYKNLSFYAQKSRTENANEYTNPIDLTACLNM